MPAPPDPRAIEQIGRYRDVLFIAEGGMSWVFKVKDPDLFDAPRALKLLKPHAAEGEEFNRFRSEAKLLAQIQHPNLIHIYEFGPDPGTGLYYYTMDFIEGCNFAEVRPDWLGSAEETVFAQDPEATRTPQQALQEKAVTLEEVCNYFVGILSALARLHRQGIVHRDVKPRNIFVNPGGSAILGDLGIAKAPDSAGMTRAGVTPGTPLYMSPEHSLGEGVSVQSDLFSLGLTMYRVLTGKTVYDNADGVDSTNSQAVLRHLWELHGGKGEFSFVFPRQIPEPLREVIRCSCQMEPGDRYRSAEEMSEALQGAILALHDAPVRTRPRIRTRRRRLSRVLGVAGVLLGAGLALFGYWYYVKWPELAARTARTKVMEDQDRLEGLVVWMAQLPTGPPSELLRQTKIELRSGKERVDDGNTDVDDGNYRGARSRFARAQSTFIQACGRLSEEFLQQGSGARVEAARAELKAVPQAAERHVPEAWTELRKLAPKLDGRVEIAGCPKAESLKERWAAGDGIVVQARVVKAELGRVWPKKVRAEIEDAERAQTEALEAVVPLRVYDRGRRVAEEHLRLARSARDGKRYERAETEATAAADGFLALLPIQPAWDARQRASSAVKRAEAADLSIGEERRTYQEAEKAFEDEEWKEAWQLFGAVSSEVGGLLQKAPIMERTRAQAILRKAKKDELPVPTEQQEYESGERAYRERRWADARRSFDDAYESLDPVLAASAPAVAARAGAEAERRKALKRVPRAALAGADSLLKDAVDSFRARLFGSAEETFNQAQRRYASIRPPTVPKPDPVLPTVGRASPTPLPLVDPPAVPPDPIRQLMLDYERAYEALDIAALNAAWRMSFFERRQIKAYMDQCSGLDLQISSLRREVDEEKGTGSVYFTEQLNWQSCRGSTPPPGPYPYRAKVKRRGEKEWQIIILLDDK